MWRPCLENRSSGIYKRKGDVWRVPGHDSWGASRLGVPVLPWVGTVFPSVSSDAHASTKRSRPEAYRCCGSVRNLRSWNSFCRSVVSPARLLKPQRYLKAAKTRKFLKVRGSLKAATFQKVRKFWKVAVFLKVWRWLLKLQKVRGFLKVATFQKGSEVPESCKVSEGFWGS